MTVDATLQSQYIEVMQERLGWCVKTERYEMAAKLRDLIKYETTDDEDFKEQYYQHLLAKYTPEDILDGMKNPTPEKIEKLKDKYLYNKGGQ